MKWTVSFSAGKWGGIYFQRNRVCFGWVAVTWLPVEIDDLLAAYVKYQRVQE